MFAPELESAQYLRGNKLSLRVWKNYNQIVDACCDAWNGFIDDTKRVISVTTRTWATVNN